MIHYDEWIFEPHVGYTKFCHDKNYNLDIIIEHVNDRWSPCFFDKRMWEIYCKYNKKYYIKGGPDDSSAAMEFMDQFLHKYNRLLIFM